MFGRRFRTENGAAQEGDERLSELLRSWKGAEPTAHFEAAVWRRIRAASAPGRRGLPLDVALRTWLGPRPAWSNALAAAAGIVIGVGLAFSTSPPRSGRHIGEPLLNPHTLAGSYLSMVTGGAR